MLNIKRFVCNPIQENTYVVKDETNECVIIDYGAFYKEEHQAIEEYIRQNKLTPVRLLCTHGHFDHCAGVAFAYEHYGLKPAISSLDSELLSRLNEQAAALLGLNTHEKPVPMGEDLSNIKQISFGNHTFRILSTPGHTPGSITFWCEEEHIAFTGDTLFQSSIGRTDFPGGSLSSMMKSLRDLTATLPADTVIYCGHGPTSTMGEELRQNPYLRMMQSKDQP